MSVKLLRLSVLCLPLLALTACGEGWEAQKTDTYFPYGNQRTAGYGVVYVRAKMMPEKELKVEPVAEEVAPEPTPEPAPIAPADEIFTEAQTKGSAPMKREVISPEPEPAVEEEDHSSMDLEENDHDMAGFEPVEPNFVEPASNDMSAEEYISQAPKQIEIPEVKIMDEAVTQEVGKVSAIAPPPPSKSPYETYNKTLVQQMQSSDVVVTHKETVEAQVEEVVSPNKDYLSGGQESLNEIYVDPF
ncbi:MAG: hypothetical protein ACRBDI_09455 [Alphaproteobacteria bacterium]